MSSGLDSRPLEEKVRETMVRFGVPGVAVGILSGTDEYAAGYGVTSVEHPLPVDADTLFQIGSITKTVTGTAVMRLAESGRLDLDAPVRRYLPDFALADEATAAQVTPRHLLTHTAGWVGDYFDDFGDGEDALARMVGTMAGLPQLTPLGQVWSYNNAGFYVAGRLIELAAGRTYEAAVRELVLEPLGMTRSTFFPSDVITHRVAVGHSVADGVPAVIRRWPLPRAANPVGGLVSTVRDQLRYARFHLGDGRAPDGTRLLSVKAMRQMQSPQAPAECDDHWGLTWGLKHIAGTRTVRHGGATAGFMASFVMIPARQFAVVVLTNAATGGALHVEVTDWTLAHYLELRVPETPSVAMTEADLAPYLGRYVAALSDLELRLQEGQLMVQLIPKGGFPVKESPASPAPPPARAAFIGRDRLIVLDGLMKGRQGEFLRRGDGSIAWLRSSRIHARAS